MKPRPIAPALLATLFLCTALPPIAAAAADEVPAQMAMEELSSRLNLTADQQTRIAPALEERNSRLKALSGELGSDGSRRQKLKALREARSIQQNFVGKVSPMLTKEQKVEWDELRDETRDKLKERRKSQE